MGVGDELGARASVDEQERAVVVAGRVVEGPVDHGVEEAVVVGVEGEEFGRDEKVGEGEGGGGLVQAEGGVEKLGLEVVEVGVGGGASLVRLR